MLKYNKDLIITRKQVDNDYCLLQKISGKFVENRYKHNQNVDEHNRNCIF